MKNVRKLLTAWTRESRERRKAAKLSEPRFMAPIFYHADGTPMTTDEIVKMGRR